MVGGCEEGARVTGRNRDWFFHVVYVSLNSLNARPGHYWKRPKLLFKLYRSCVQWRPGVATIHQKRQRALVAAHRRYQALGFAYKIGPIVKPMLLNGMSQRQIAEELTRLQVPTASEWNHESRGRQPAGKNRWNQTQVSRLLKNMGAVAKKMKWYYVHAHREVLYGPLEEAQWHPSTNEPTSYKLMAHRRKKPREYYQSKATEYRRCEMDKAGYHYSTEDAELFQLQWRRFVNLRSYHRRKRKKAASA